MFMLPRDLLEDEDEDCDPGTSSTCGCCTAEGRSARSRFWTPWRRGRGRFARRGRGPARRPSAGGRPLRTAPLRTRRSDWRRFASCFAPVRATCARAKRQRGAQGLDSGRLRGAGEDGSRSAGEGRRDGQAQEAGTELVTVPLRTRHSDSRWFVSCFALFAPPVRANDNRERGEISNRQARPRGMIADIHSRFGYMRFRIYLRRPGLTSFHRKKFAVGNRSPPSPQGGDEDRLLAPKPQAIVFPASLRQFFGAHSLKTSARTL